MRLTILLRFEIFQSIFGTRRTFIALICNETKDTWRLCAIGVYNRRTFHAILSKILTKRPRTNLPKDRQLETELDYFFFFLSVFWKGISNLIAICAFFSSRLQIPRSLARDIWGHRESSSRRAKRDVRRGSSENLADHASYVRRLRNYSGLGRARGQEGWRARR